MFIEPCIANVFLSTTNEMQSYTMFFIVVSALRVPSAFSAHHQELKKLYMQHRFLSNLCVVIASLVESELGSLYCVAGSDLDL
jgi:hypothetical protein